MKIADSPLELLPRMERGIAATSSAQLDDGRVVTPTRQSGLFSWKKEQGSRCLVTDG